MKTSTIACLLLIIACFGGCGQFSGLSFKHQVFKSSFVEMTGDELQQHLGNSNRHSLVEFCECSECRRCSSKKLGISDLASTYKDCTEFVRVDFASNAELTAACGVKVCPTYVIFEKGQTEPAFVHSFPVSRDKLEADLLAVIALSN